MRPPAWGKAGLFKDGPGSRYYLPIHSFCHRVGGGMVGGAGIMADLEQRNCLHQFRRVIGKHYLNILPCTLKAIQGGCGFVRRLCA
eukprot:12037411-Heterocapsa_arctica.AAC.1